MTGFIIGAVIIGFGAFIGLAALWDGVFKLSSEPYSEHGVIMLVVGLGLCTAAYFGASYL